MRPAGIIRNRPPSAVKLASLSGRRGQALLIAVLLMMVILLVGILFVALVSRNQQQSVRHVDVITGQALAEAGVRYADRMLQTSPLGADWRPRFVPYDGAIYDENDPSTWPSPPAMYTSGDVDLNFYGPDGVEGTEDDYYSDFDVVRAWCPLRSGSIDAPGPFLRFGYHRYPDPNPGAAASVATNNPTLGRGYVLLRVTYDPDPPYEPGDSTDQVNLSNCIRIEAIGRVSDQSTVFRRLVAYKPIGLTDHLRWVTDWTRSGKRAYLGLRPYMDFDNSGTTTDGEALEIDLGGPVRADTALYMLGQPLGSGPSTPSTYFDLLTAPSDDGYLRDDMVEGSEGIYIVDSISDGVGVRVEGVDEGTLPTSLAAAETTTIPRVTTGHREVPPLQAPDITATDPTTGMDRYRVLTRDSGVSVCSDSMAGTVKNTGRYGHGAGIYIDNFADIQFKQADGTCNLKLLVQDWRKEPGSIGMLSGDSGWNALGTTYTPPAVEIEFFPSEAAVLATATNGYSDDTSGQTGPGELWWPGHVAGEPGIKITRHDYRWALGDPAKPTEVGDDSGANVMVIDYPEYPNQCVFAEGSIRVKGVLPSADRAGDGQLIRDYNLTIVSNATIYIDGQILSPQDVAGRRYGTNDGASGVLDEDNTAVALLARDFVCLNPTQLVPQLTFGMVAAAPDDEMAPELGQHWELDTGGRVYTRWMFGETVPAGVARYLTVQQTAASPGPSGVGLALSNDGTITAHSFGNPVDPYTFVFAPEGALLWDLGSGPIPAPQPYCSTAIAPQWQPPASIGPYSFANPTVPWNIGAGISGTVGVPNAAALSQRDPQLGTPATEYWVKKWKIEEIDTDNSRPRGAINAKVNAMIYAQRGSWFVIPGAYFDESTYTVDFDDDGDIDGDDSLWAARMRRYNYRITVRGCITEDHTAQIEDAQDWSNKWAFPIYTSATELTWGTIEYQFDDRLRVNRDQDPTNFNSTTNVRNSANRLYTPQANLPKLPLLPVSPTLLYYGEAF